MQTTPFLASLTGYVTLDIKGGSPEAFINDAAGHRIFLWDIRFRAPLHLECRISVHDFFRLRPLLKKSGCRLHVKERRGFPFLLDRLEKRKWFAAGLAGFLIGLYLLTSMVWRVDVEGNEKLKTADILDQAKRQGIRVYQWKFRLKSPEILSHDLSLALPGTSWVGVEIKGTRVLIKVAESKAPKPAELTSPRHLVASKNAMVTQIFAERGKPLVQPNTYVRQGDVLISGILGGDTNSKIVSAAGRVLGLVWYTTDVEVPKRQVQMTYTGEAYSRFYLVFGSRALQITGYGKKPFAQTDIRGERKALGWKNYSLPIGWINEQVSEVHRSEQELSAADARRIGLERARAELLREAGTDAKVTGETIMQETDADGVLKLKVHYEVEEEIMMEQAIVEGSS